MLSCFWDSAYKITLAAMTGYVGMYNVCVNGCVGMYNVCVTECVGMYNVCVTGRD